MKINEQKLDEGLSLVLLAMKGIIIGIIIDFILIPLLQSPILEQHLANCTTHFSIISSIRTDLDEHQLNTPYFIIDTLKHHIQVTNNK